MTWKNESDFTRWFSTKLKECNCEVLAIVASKMQLPGVPDRRFWGRDLPGVWCEFKRDRGQLSTRQRLWMERVDSFDDPCLVIRIVGDKTVIAETPKGEVLGMKDVDKRRTTGVELRTFLVKAVGVRRVL